MSCTGMEVVIIYLITKWLTVAVLTEGVYVNKANEVT